jgi:hypothetical protein
MANRHKFNKGGRTAYSGGSSNVVKEAESNENFKKGGKAVKMSGHKGKSRYASGGRAGCDKNPFSSAHRG